MRSESDPGPTGQATPGAERPTDEGGHGDCRTGGLDTRGVSYALGFVIVFSAVLAGTLALFVVGVDVLSDVGREETVTANRENVEVIHSEVGDVTSQGAASRDLTLELVDARLRFTGREALQLNVSFEGAGSDTQVQYGTQALHYEVVDHGTTFVYAFGHAYRVENGGAVSEQPPVFEVSDTQTRLIVPVLTGVTADSPAQIGVDGTSERDLVAVRSNASSFTRTGTGTGPGAETITGSVTVEGVTHPSVWEQALASTGFEDIEVSETVVTGYFESERLRLRQADIALGFGGEGP